MNDPMKKGSFVHKNVPEVEWVGISVSCRDRVSCRGWGVS